MDMDMQLTVQRARMDIELAKGTIDRSIAARKELTDRMIEDTDHYILDQKRLDEERRASARRSTYFISYLGHMEAGSMLDKYIEDFSAAGTVTRIPIIASVCEWKGLQHFWIEEIGCENSIAPAILEIMGGLGITGTIKTPYEMRFDTFPLEELYHD